MTVRVVNSVLDSSLAVVECLAIEARKMRLSEIADRLGLQRSGTHRMLTALCGLGWVEQDPDSEQYQLTFKLAALGHAFIAGARILDVCQPVVDRLAQESRELVRLAVVDNNELTTIAHAQGAQGSLVCQSRVFPKLPLHVTASGKAWLATMPDDAALKLVLAAGLGKATEYGKNAVLSASGVLREIKKTRERGYGIAVEEAEPGVSAVAVTVFPRGDVTRGVLAIVAPAVRMGERRIQE